MLAWEEGEEEEEKEEEGGFALPPSLPPSGEEGRLSASFPSGQSIVNLTVGVFPPSAVNLLR